MTGSIAMRRAPALAALALALASQAPAALAAELIVVEARGVSFKPGQKIDDTTKLTLGDGQRLTLIAANGRTLKLSGPYDQVPSAEGAAEDTLSKATAALEALKVQKTARLTEIGTVRAVFNEVPEPWVLDAEHEGNLCVREGQRLVFWRKNAGAAADFVLAPSDRSWSVRHSWPAGVDRLDIPTLFPIRDKATYVVRLAGKEVPVTFNVIPAAVANDTVRASWMYEKGCMAQAAELAKTIGQPSPR
jgi:hypothetical protein